MNQSTNSPANLPTVIYFSFIQSFNLLFIQSSNQSTIFKREKLNSAVFWIKQIDSLSIRYDKNR